MKSKTGEMYMNENNKGIEYFLSTGRKIKHTRKYLNMSQSELAKLVHTSQKQISFYESNEQNITIEKLLEIADALNVEPSKLLPKLNEYRQRPSYLSKYNITID